jgi:20S proteasome subunit alpha 2
MGPDFRKLITNAQKASHKDYKLIYNEYPPVEICVEMAAQEMQKATQQGGTRPYGVSLLIAGWDEKGGKRGKKGPSLYQVDPSGTYFGWKATAIGKNATSAKTFLEKRYSPDVELEDAIHIALLTLKETIEGEMNGDTIELGMLVASYDLVPTNNLLQVLLDLLVLIYLVMKELKVPLALDSESSLKQKWRII